MRTTCETEKKGVFENLNKGTDEFCTVLAGIERDIRSGIRTPEECVPALTDAIERSCKACAEAEEGAGDNLREMQEYFRERIRPYFSQSWFMHRGLTKPRGYPGDYAMLEGIYNEETKSEGFGKALDLYFLQSTLARAVRGRKDKCREIIEAYVPHDSNGSYRILDIASGPCRELHSNGLPPFEFVGMDYDEESLDYARNAVFSSGFKKYNITFVKQNVLRLTSGQRNVESFGKFDLIYSVGLYDYLPDKVLLRVLQGSAAMLKENGRYVVAFKDCERYDKNEYQWHVDWFFFPRTEEECSKIVTDSGLRIVKKERDESGVIIFYTLELQ